MSKLEELIQKLCPNGVEYKAMDELGYFYCGISGKSRDDFVDGNAKFITYKNIYSNLALNLAVDDKVKIEENENQNTIQYGDVLFTGSSETPDECGFSSVLTTQTEEKLYLNSFCFGYRFFNNSLFLPDFSKYLFRSQKLRVAIGKTASGVTRFNVSKKKMGKIRIPVPPIEVQEEIVRILDKFTELTAELTARKKQYEFYRDKWLNNIHECKIMRICDFAECVTGATPSTSKREYWENGTIQWMSSGEVNLFEVFQTEKKITQLGYEKCSTTIVPIDTVVIALAGQGKTRGKVAITRTPLCTNQSLCSIIVNQNIVNSEYLLFYLQSKYEDLRRISSGDGTRGGLNLKMINNYTVPIPPLNTQQNIIKKLKYFSKLCNDISEGLPAEIEARQKQYEYYRDKLLTFKELA